MVSEIPYSIRLAAPADVPAIYALILELAEYEKLTHSVVSTEQDIYTALFGEKPAAECLVSYMDEKIVGMALFFQSFSTFAGKPGLYLEDVYVKPEYRSQGIGKALLIHLAQIARDRNYCRMEWSVLNWNEPAIQFYKSLGAMPLSEWTVYRMSGEPVTELSGEMPVLKK